MKVYTEENQAHFVQSIASASTLISSLTGEVREFVLSKFSKNFFKSVYIDTREAITEQNTNEKYNKTLHKKNYPILSISPEITLDDPIGGMEKSMHMSSPNLYLKKDMRRNYRKILIDPDSKYSMYFTSDYITTNFNFKITVNKFIQNMDLAYYIKANFQEDFFHFLNGKYLNTEIPKLYVAMIAGILNYDLDNPNDLMALERYLIATSKRKGVIERKINLATGKDCFFVNETINPLFIVRDITAPASVERDIRNESEYSVDFTVQVSAWLPNSFIFSADIDKLNGIDPGDINEEQQDPGFYSVTLPQSILANRQEMIRFTGSSDEEHIGQEVVQEKFTYPISLEAISMNLGDLLRDDFKRVHAYMVSRNLDTRDLYNVQIYDREGLKQLEIIDEGLTLTPEELAALYGSINYETMELSLLLEKGMDFSLTIYANRLLFEAINKAIDSDKFFFKLNALAFMYININGESINVPVYSFQNETEMKVFTAEKSLRVNTIYGEGYIGLVPIDDGLASEYHVAVDAEWNTVSGFTSDEGVPSHPTLDATVYDYYTDTLTGKLYESNGTDFWTYTDIILTAETVNPTEDVDLLDTLYWNSATGSLFRYEPIVMAIELAQIY